MSVSELFQKTPSIASPFSIKLDFDLNQIRSGSQRNKQNGKNLLPIQEVLASDAVIDDDVAGMISEDKNTVIEMPDQNWSKHDIPWFLVKFIVPDDGKYQK